MRDDLNAALAGRIREAMPARKLSMRQLSKLTGIEYETMRSYLSARSSMPARLVPSIARALNVSCDWLLTGVAADLDPVELEHAIVGAFTVCSADEGFDAAKWARLVFFMYNRDYELRFGRRHEVAPLPREILDRWSGRPSKHIAHGAASEIMKSEKAAG